MINVTVAALFASQDFQTENIIFQAERKEKEQNEKRIKSIHVGGYLFIKCASERREGCNVR